MRKIFCLTAVAFVAGIAAYVVASPAKATTTPQWYTVSTALVAGPGHTLQIDVAVTNVGTITHTANIVVSLKGPSSYGMSMPIAIKLAPGEKWTWGVAATVVPKGTYTGAIKAAHLFERNDPAALQNAPNLSASSTVLVK